MRIKSASQKGAAMVEFALILIPLAYSTFGIIEFGLLMYNQQVLTNASQGGGKIRYSNDSRCWRYHDWYD